MTVLEALAISSRECSEERLTPKKVREALDFLEAHIQLPWVIPQFRYSLGREENNPYSMREG